MFVRKTQRKYKGKVYVTHLLVESVRTPDGPRQKTICSLGDLSPRPLKEWHKLAERVTLALRGQYELFACDQAVDDRELQAIVDKIRQENDEDVDEVQLVSVQVDKVRTESHRAVGPVHVGFQFWKRLGFDEVLEACGFDRRTRELSCAMVLNRLISPSSEHAMPDWMRSTALADILGLDFGSLAEDALYRNMDRLYPQRENIEGKLFERSRTLFNLDESIYLYDLTSTYFEGQALGNEKAARGYSRDKRPDCKQVVVGLVLNRDGFPIAHEIYAGNTQDRSTVEDMLNQLDRRVGLKPGQTIVVDRGMAFEENLKAIQARGLHYLVASRQPERNQWLAEFEGLEGFQEIFRKTSPTNPYQVKSRVMVKRLKTEDETLILCLGSNRVAKDRAIREKAEEKLCQDLNRLKKRVESGRLRDPGKIGEAIGRLKERHSRVARYYQMSYDKNHKRFGYKLDRQRRQLAEQLDGCYILKTDRHEFDADQAWLVYNLLSRVENAFRTLKTPLQERPIYHQITRRVETHIFLCVMAYHLLIAIEQTLKAKGDHRSWVRVRDQLSTHQVATVVLPTRSGSELHIRNASRPEPIHEELYNLLDIPSKVMRPVRTWVEAPLSV